MSRRSARVSPRGEVHRVYWRHRRHLPESWTKSPLLRRRHPDVHCHSTVEAHTVAPRVVLDDFNWMQPRLKSSGSAQRVRETAHPTPTQQSSSPTRQFNLSKAFVTSASISTVNLTCRRTLPRQHKQIRCLLGRDVLLVCSPRLYCRGWTTATCC